MMKHKQDRDWEYGYHTSIPIDEEKRQRKKLEHFLEELEHLLEKTRRKKNVGSRDL